MGFAVALSEHPDAAHAIGECVGQLLDAHGPHPDLVALFVTAAHAPRFAELCAVARQLLQPACLMGATATAVLGADREVQDQPAVSVWAGWGVGEVAGVHLSHGPAAAPLGLARQDGNWDRLDELATPPGTGHSLLLLADPMTFPVDDLLARLAVTHPELVVVGGLCSAGGRPGDSKLCLDGAVPHGGAVAVVVDQRLDTVVSQGCRPVGDPFTVTKASGNVLDELGSRPALSRLQELAQRLSVDDRALLARGLHLGRVVDEHLAEHRRGDFLIRAVLGAQGDSGALVIGDRISVGDTVQFQVRDADSAHEDLVELLGGRQADAALVFTCNGRGTHLFDTEDHDASTICELTGTSAVGGLFCAGEVGPVGSRSFLHGFTASVALFRERSNRT